jgi:superfamily II DNA or RNA helicase
MLIEICERQNLVLNVVDKRPPWAYTPITQEAIGPDFLPGITLDPHQIEATKRACKIECGIVDVPTGGGKGEIICCIAKAIQCPTIILADQTIVISQLKKRLELRDVAEEIGMFYAGKRPNDELIVVGSIQSLSPPTKPPDLPTRKDKETDAQFAKRSEKWDKLFKAYQTRRKNAKFVQQYVKNAEMIMIDECDKASSEQYKNLFRHYFTGRRRYGFSGTPMDAEKPVQAMVMQEHLGSPFIKVSRRYLERINRIIPCSYYMMAFGMDGDIGEASAYDIAYNAVMVENEKFHKLIVSICEKFKDDNTLILVDRITLGEKLEVAIRDAGFSANFICGETTKRRRDKILKEFENREFNVLIGGKIINRGLDLSGGCDNLIIATGGKLESEFIQKVGRALRHNRRGHSRVFDFYFRCNKYLYSHSKARLKAMVNAGYQTTVIFPGGKIDGAQLIKSRFSITKHLRTKCL